MAFEVIVASKLGFASSHGVGGFQQVVTEVTATRHYHSGIATESQNAADAEKWIALMKECVNPAELTAELLNTLIEKIVVHEAVKGEDGSLEQEVEIFYRFIGKIDCMIPRDRETNANSGCSECILG